MGDWAGMNWIRKEKRLAIYLRDGLACAYCGKGIEECVLALDHLITDGPNDPTNLITSCTVCNSVRQHLQDWEQFARDPQLVARILRLTNQPVSTKSAKLILAQHDWDWTATINSLKLWYAANR